MFRPLEPLPEEVWVRITQWCIIMLLQDDHAQCLSKSRLRSVLALRLLSPTSRPAVLSAVYGQMVISCVQREWLRSAIAQAPFLPTHTLVLGVALEASAQDDCPDWFSVLPHAFPKLVSLSVIVCACRVGSWDAKSIEGLLYALAALLRRMNDLERLSVTVDLPESDASVSVEHLMDAIELSKLYHVRLCLMGFSVTSSHAVVLPESLYQKVLRGNTASHNPSVRLLGGSYSLERLVLLKLEDVPVSFTAANSLRVLSQLKRLDLHPSAWVEWPVDGIADEETLLPDVMDAESPPWHGGGTGHMDPADDEHSHAILITVAMEWEHDERMTLSPTEEQYARCFLEHVVRDLLRLEVLHIGGAMHDLRRASPSQGRRVWEEIWSLCASHADLRIIGFGRCDARPSTHRHMAIDCGSCRENVGGDRYELGFGFRLHRNWQTARTACITDIQRLCASSSFDLSWTNPGGFFPPSQATLWTRSAHNTRFESTWNEAGA
ncbi:hypothetical protein EXIGLDRAFT_771443 [Exidia glandulosa HHB12029]|uniref:Uncharacterized protein n=1 Tax=Exidia glandulosa HHB12029 TaxID=1314781 RepID=A0A165FZK4_EXIGL|nr:hypothetical protein EXIGLDRAFT_771443 [Exidia glandulosa HHB12029]